MKIQPLFASLHTRGSIPNTYKKYPLQDSVQRVWDRFPLLVYFSPVSLTATLEEQVGKIGPLP